MAEKSKYYFVVTDRDTGERYRIYFYGVPGITVGEKWEQPFTFEGTDLTRWIWDFDGITEDVRKYFDMSNGAYIAIRWVNSNTRGLVLYDTYGSEMTGITSTWSRMNNSPTSYRLRGFCYNITDPQTWENQITPGYGDGSITTLTFPADDNIAQQMNSFFLNYEPETDSGEPGPNEPAGGDGDFDNSSDQVAMPEAPTFKNPGNAALFAPSREELLELINWLWSDNLITSLLKANSDPMENIVSLHLVPVEPPTGPMYDVRIGNVVSPTLQIPIVSNQFMTYDCGTVTLKEYWGSALDYSPYTDVTIYLPFIGTNQLDANIVMGSDVSVRYTIDLLSGLCVASIRVVKPAINLDAVMYTFSGNISTPLPLYAGQQPAWSRITTEIIKGSSGIVLGAALGGVGGVSAASSAGTGKAAIIGDEALTGAAQAAQGSIGQTPNASSPRSVFSGSLAYNIGWLSAPTPFFIIDRPIQAVAENAQALHGYPCNITETLSNLTGWTQIDKIQLSGIGNATEEELVMIENELRRGVIL